MNKSESLNYNTCFFFIGWDGWMNDVVYLVNRIISPHFHQEAKLTF